MLAFFVWNITVDRVTKKLTAQEFINRLGDDRAELIDGQISMMAPASAEHSHIQASIARLVGNFTEKKKGSDNGSGLWVLTEAWTQYDQYNSFVHDIAAFEKEKLQTLPAQGPIAVRPLWICEVLSPSNWSNDTQKKRVVLEKHGVPYYWLVIPDKKVIQVYFLKHEDEHYQILYSAAIEEKKRIALPPFDDLEIDLSKLFS